MRNALGLTLVLALATPALAEENRDGTWSGPVTQVDSDNSYGLVLTLQGSSGETSYPELKCKGAVNQIADFNGIAIFSERIIEGAYSADNPDGCIDGIFSLAPDGDTLMWSWFGRFEDEAYIAYARLGRK